MSPTLTAASEHLLSSGDLTTTQWNQLLGSAETLAGPTGKQPLLAGRRFGMLLLNPSLRTRTAFEVACQDLGTAAVTLQPGGGLWALEHRDGVVMDGECAEHVTEAVGVLGRMLDALGVRAFAGLADLDADRGEPVLSAIAKRASIPVLNLESAFDQPATIDGMLAASFAETLAALVLVNLFEPGFPMIFSNWPFVIDLRTGAFCGGGGEISILNAGAAQLANHIGVPSGVASSMSDAKAVDAQMGMEKALSSLACGLSGANMVYESSGMMASLLGVSFEAFLLDNEMLSHVYRMIRGVEVSEETLAFEAMRNVITGEGHFIGETQTMEAMERDYYYPKLGDRLEPTTWAEAGAEDAWQRANREVREVLAQPEVNHIDAALDAKLRKQFNILI